jgi:uncharacterized protein (DUF2141 family)
MIGSLLTSWEGTPRVHEITPAEVLDMPRARLLNLAFCLAAFVSRPSRLSAEPPTSSSPDAGRPTKPAPARPARSTVTVKIQGLRHDRGTIFVALYDNRRAFAAKQGQVHGTTIRPRNRGALVVFDNVLPGKYALAFFQDENGNQKLDTNLLGIPTEGFGFSRDAMGKVGPPTFEAAALDIPAGPVVVVMNAKYY